MAFLTCVQCLPLDLMAVALTMEACNMVISKLMDFTSAGMWLKFSWRWRWNFWLAQLLANFHYTFGSTGPVQHLFPLSDPTDHQSWVRPESSAPLFTRLSRTCYCTSDDTTTIDLKPMVSWWLVHLWIPLFSNMVFATDKPWAKISRKLKTNLFVQKTETNLYLQKVCSYTCTKNIQNVLISVSFNFLNSCFSVLLFWGLVLVYVQQRWMTTNSRLVESKTKDRLVDDALPHSLASSWWTKHTKKTIYPEQWFGHPLTWKAAAHIINPERLSVCH